jgi:hypothetical protein
MLTRFVRLNNRFEFENIWLGEGKQGRLQIPGIFTASAEALIEQKEGHICIQPVRGEILLNGQVFVDEQELSDKDRITLKSDRQTDEWVFQMEPAAAKATRQEQERASNVVRHPPDFSGNERHKRWLRARFQADESGVKVKQFFRFKHRPWQDLDEIRFKPGGSGAFGGGLILMAVQSSMGKAKGSSEFDVLFKKGLSRVFFHYQGRQLAFFQDVQARTCVLIAQAIECYSPIDLVKMA